MSIATEISRLQTAKVDIKGAIEDMGVNVPSSVKVDDYPPYIAQINGIDPSNGHDYVEIAGMKWATMNVGAESVTDYGQVFQWGDTTGYLSGSCGATGVTLAKAFKWEDYKFSGGRTNPAATGKTKYNGADNKTVLDLCDDAARAKWGGNWRTPTFEEIKALSGAVTTAWTDDYQGTGVSGLVLTDKTDSNKVLFFPKGFYCNQTTVITTGSAYWTSSTYGNSKDFGYSFSYGKTAVQWENTSRMRFLGLAVRPILGNAVHREYVDLGLPSGTLWAKCNIGAESETEYGNYYQYGKGADTYQTTSGQSNYEGTENPLSMSVDTARQVMGGQWHMPTSGQCEELINNTTYTWETNFNGSGINGGKFTASNGKYVFFPAADMWDNGSQYYVGSDGFCWSSTPNDSNYAYYLLFDSSNKDVDNYYRSYGFSVRGVLDKYEYVDLGLPSGTKWATKNVGASTETDYGNYYQYGKGADTYQVTSGQSVYTGTEDPLDSSVDTATKVMGKNWCMPTQTQWEELSANTTYSWATINGVAGAKFTASNGKYVFFPAAGFWNNGSQDLVGSNGDYWSSSPGGSNYAYVLDFSSRFKGVNSFYRRLGCSVRGVRKGIEPTITSKPKAKTGVVYTGSPQELLSGGTANVSGTFTYGTAVNTGSYSVTWEFTPTDLTTYSKVRGTALGTIAKAAGVVTTPPTNSNPTYNSGGYLCTTGSGTGTMLYKLGSGSYSSTRPTTSGLNAGSYTLYYKTSASTNYNESSEANITVTIAKAAGSVSTKPTAKSLTYNGNAQALVTAGSGTGTMMYKLGTGSWGASIPSGTNATNYVVYYKASASTNYNESASGSVSVTIARANRTMSWSSAPSSVQVSNTVTATATKTGDGTIVYSSSNTSIATINSSTGVITGVGGGSCTIKASVAQTTNYNSASTSYTLSVTDPYAGHAYVDLGLPSGTKWAKCNVGAASEVAYGNYYQYGKGTAAYQATSGQSVYSGAENPLSMSVDTARQVWGGQWHMPTSAQCEELVSNTTRQWTTISGVSGNKFINKTDSSKYVFFPSGGYYQNGSKSGDGQVGMYWSSTPVGSSFPTGAWGLNSTSGTAVKNQFARNMGLLVRGVVG